MKMTKLMECGEKLLKENKVERAVACFAKAGKTDPAAWVEFACIYRQGIGVAADHARAKRFERRAREIVVRNRDMARRFERQQRNPMILTPTRTLAAIARWPKRKETT